MSKNLKSQIEELRLGWQRTQADFENYKKRTEEDKANWSRSTKVEVLEKILPILDNLTLAATHTPEELKDNSWALGINHISKQIEDSFGELGIEKVSPKPSDKFDHTIHEAVSVQESKIIPEDSIIKTEMDGFKIEGVLTRPAKVVVSKGNGRK